MTYKAMPFDYEEFHAGAKLIHGNLIELDRAFFPSRTDVINIMWIGGYIEAINISSLGDTRNKYQLQIPVVEEVMYMNIYKDDHTPVLWRSSLKDAEINRESERFSGYVLRGIFIDGKLSAKPEVLEVEKEIVNEVGEVV